MQTKLVIDLGSKYLSLSVFSVTTQEDQPVLLEVVVRDVEGKNNNIVGRTIEREFRALCAGHPVDEVIILPRKTSVVHQTVNLEYLNDEKAMKKKLLEQINLPGAPGEYITDWVVQDDNPEQDYQKVFISSINVSEFKFISETMKTLGVRSYKIGCPSANISCLFPHDDRPYLLLQIGHKGTEMYILKNGVFEMYRVSRTFSSYHLTNVILSMNSSLPPDELYRLKNNATFSDLENNNAISEILTFISDDVSKFVESYHTLDATPIVGFALIGGIANLDFETLMEMADLAIPRTYPRLPVANHMQLPYNVRNYLYESACICLEDDDGINFTSPKDKSIGQYIKLLTTLYEYGKIPLYLIVLGLLLNMGTYYVQNYLLEEKIATESPIVSNYQAEVDSLKSTVEELQKTYEELLDDKELKIVNYGEVLAKLSEIIPQGTFLTNITDITHEYIGDSFFDPTTLTQPAPTDQSAPLPTGDGTVNGLELSTQDMLVALELTGYTNQRVKAFDYALLLKEIYRDAVVTNVALEGDVHKYTIHVIIDK